MAKLLLEGRYILPTVMMGADDTVAGMYSA
jgi:hypothetical protein